MFDLGILDVGIGMAFLFLAVSLICSAVREFIETFMKTRAMDLERGLRELLADQKGTGFTKSLFEHPLISGLFTGTYDPKRIKTTALSGGDERMPFRHRRNLPSYIPSGQFASALMDLVVRRPNALPYPAPPLSLETLRSAAAALDNDQVRRAVLSAIDLGGDDIQKVKANIESWFNGTMDRVAGWYKRRTQLVLFLVGLFVAIVMNVDAITVADRFGTDAELRGAVVAAAGHTVKSPSGDAAPSPVDVDEVRNQLVKVGFPIGWVGGRPGPQFQMTCAARQATQPKLVTNPTDPPCSDVGVYVQIVFGWLITAVATMLGAPFWFDVLNKFMVIRSTVKPHEKSREEGSEDRGPSTDRPTTPAPAVRPDGLLLAPGAFPASIAPPPDYVPNEWNTPGTKQEGVL